MKISLLIQAVDRASANLKKIRGSAADLAGGRGLGQLATKTKEAGRALDRFGAGTAVRARISALLGQVRSLAGRAGLGAVRRSAELAVAGLKKVGAAALRIGMYGAAGGVALAGWMTGGVIGIASTFEQFQIVLENTEGSAAKAQKAMAWVKEFAKKTPYEVSQVMEAFVALKSYGIDPMDGSLESLGNAASGMNKHLMQAVEMLADAQTGEFERLKEFGIRASAQGKKVTFTYMQNGKEMKISTQKNAVAMKRAITGIFDQRFAGMMDRQSRSLAGLWSNIKDMAAGFQLDIADAGFFDFVKGKVQQLLDKVNELAKDGTLARWAKQVSHWLEEAGAKAFDFIENTDWKQVADDVQRIASAAWNVAKAMAKIVELAGKLPRAPTLFGRSADDLFSGTGYRDAYNWLQQRSPTMQPRRPAGRGAQGWSARGAPGRSQGWSIRQPGPRASAPPLRQGRGDGSLLRRPTAEVGGRLDVRIQTDPGTKATVTTARSANRNVPIDVTRGPVLAA